MSVFKVAKTVVLVALVASRHPAVRAAVRKAPELLTEERKKAALAVTRQVARKAGEMTARIIPPNRFF